MTKLKFDNLKSAMAALQPVVQANTPKPVAPPITKSNSVFKLPVTRPKIDSRPPRNMGIRSANIPYENKNWQHSENERLPRHFQVIAMGSGMLKIINTRSKKKPSTVIREEHYGMVVKMLTDLMPDPKQRHQHRATFKG